MDLVVVFVMPTGQDHEIPGWIDPSGSFILPVAIGEVPGIFIGDVVEGFGVVVEIIAIWCGVLIQVFQRRDIDIEIVSEVIDQGGAVKDLAQGGPIESFRLLGDFYL